MLTNYNADNDDIFVLRDYTGTDPGDKPVITSVLSASELLKVIKSASETSQKITISPVGDPIIDYRKR